MKKTLILIGLFIITVVAGFIFAEKMDLFKDFQGKNPTHSQVNYLLIRVDDLTKTRPVLQTIWGIFISFSDQTSVYFQPIYPSANAHADFRALFALNEQGLPEEAFIKALEKYDLNLTGYLVLDDSGSQTFQTWLAAPDRTTLSSTSLSLQRPYFDLVCKGLSASTFSKLQPPDWKALYPDHLIPSPKIEDIMTLFDRLFFRSSRIECHVLD